MEHSATSTKLLPKPWGQGFAERTRSDGSGLGSKNLKRFTETTSLSWPECGNLPKDTTPTSGCLLVGLLLQILDDSGRRSGSSNSLE